MTYKNNLHIVLVVIIVMLLGIGAYFVFIERTESPLPATESPPTPYLTTNMALSLLQEKNLLAFNECSLEGDTYNYQSCVIEVVQSIQEENQWATTITYDGLFDDSIRATRSRFIITYQDGQWDVGGFYKTQKCWPDRGHQEFAAKLCI